jgi:predicted nucleic acid-binding protein
LNTEIKDTSPVLFNREQAPRTATEQQGTQQLPNDAQTAATAKKKKGNATKNQQLSNGPQRVGTAKKKTN